MIIEELRNLIEQAGITPDKADLTQVHAAVMAIASAQSGLDTTAGDARYARRSANLSDLDSANTARNNLSVYSQTDTDSAISTAITSAIDALVGGAPGALDTLNELADALNDDADFHTTITNALALKANLASPTFTGSPRSTNPSTGDNSTRIATTAWIRDFFGSASYRSFTTGGSHSYNWEWQVENGLAIIQGGTQGSGGIGVFRQATRDISLTNLGWSCAFAHGDTIWFGAIVGAATQFFAHTVSTGARDSGEDFTVQFPASGAATDGTTVFLINVSGTVRQGSFADKQFDANDDFNAPTGNYQGIAIAGPTMWLLDTANNTARAYTVANQNADTSSDISLPSATYFGATSDGTTLWFLDNTNNDLIAYTAATQARDTDSDAPITAGTYNSAIHAGITIWLIRTDTVNAEAYGVFTTGMIRGVESSASIGATTHTGAQSAQATIQELSGLSIGDTITISVGRGGIAGFGGTAGNTGSVVIIPRY